MIPWLFASVASAEDALSLEAALARALEVSEDLLLTDAATARATGQMWSARAGLLPTLNAGVSYQHQFSSQFDGVFGSAPATPTGTGTPTGSTPTGEAEEPLNPFAVKDTWQVSLQAQQGIYGGGRTGAAWKIANEQIDLAEMSTESARATVTLVVTSAYYDAILAERLVEIAASTLAQSETTLANTELAGSVGRTSEFDVLRARVDVQNQRVSVIQAERGRALARLQLANLLDLPPGELAPTEDLEDPRPVDDIVTSLLGPMAEGERNALRQAESAVEISESSVTLARASGLPSVGATANVAFIGWSENVLPPTGGDDWRDAVSVSVQATVPIFNGGAVRGQIHSAKAGVVEAEARLHQSREAAEAQLADALEALRASEAQWEATSGTVEQAERAYSIADVRFREGVSTQVELADARLLRQRALANRAQAARDLQVARMRLSLMPLLPLR